MLSRVADSIYWMSRYVERAENVARFIDVNLNLMLDAPSGDDQQWRPLVNITGDHAIFEKNYPGGATQQNVSFITNLGHRLSSENFLQALKETFGNDVNAQSNPARIEEFLGQALDYPEHRFDAVLIWDVLEYLSPPLLTAVVEDDLPADDDAVRFARETLERHAIGIAVASSMPEIAAQAAHDLGIR